MEVTTQNLEQLQKITAVSSDLGMMIDAFFNDTKTHENELIIYYGTTCNTIHEILYHTVEGFLIVVWSDEHKDDYYKKWVAINGVAHVHDIGVIQAHLKDEIDDEPPE